MLGNIFAMYMWITIVGTLACVLELTLTVIPLCEGIWRWLKWEGKFNTSCESLTFSKQISRKMNLCNYAKVIIARATKDAQTIQWWNKNDQQKLPDSVPSRWQSTRVRHEIYLTFMHKYPKMHISFENFNYKLPRIQNYLTNNKYWKNNNKRGEKAEFIQFHNLQNWYKLSESQKKSHQLLDCNICQYNVQKSTLHTSAISTAVEVHDLCNTLLDNIPSTTKSIQKQNSDERKVEKVLNIMEPIIEKKFHTNLKDAACKKYKLIPKPTSHEKETEKMTILRQNKNEMTKILENKENEISNFLSSSKSYSEYHRERLDTFFESKSKAKQNLQKRFQDEQQNKKKPKRNIGKFSSYQFDKPKFLTEIRSKASGSNISWTELGKKYNVKNSKGNKTGNAGQVLLHFARENGIDVFQFNKTKRISGRDYFRRVRRPKQKLLKRLSIPVSKPVRKLTMVIKNQLESGELYIGEKIAPKVIKTNIIDKNGKMVDRSHVVYGRQIPLKKLLCTINAEQENMGIIKASSEGISRHLKIWHDHSDILNRSYFSIMVSCLYDNKYYLTDEEFQKKFPDKTPISIQSIVEKPHMYIFGQSKSTDVDQMSYTETRVKDLKDLHIPTTTPSGIKVYDILRVFTGDNPARQFESGQQRGGNYSCLCGIHVSDHRNIPCAYTQQQMALAERFDHFKGGVMFKNFSSKNINPLTNLNKEDLTDELDARNIDVYNLNKAELQIKLTDTMHGIQRPPALLCPFILNKDPIYEINCQQYEIMTCEPLHDITNVVQNLLTELPYHMPSTDLQKQYISFCNLLIGDKNQIKGSDARLYAIKLALFTRDRYDEGLVSADILTICNALVEIIRICYSPASERSSKQILRLYNQCFQFAFLANYVIGNPKKLTSRKFYGAHFHSLSTHFPEIHRLFCLRSLIPEDEERSFGELRSLAQKTSNRQASHVVDTCMLRYLAKEKKNDRSQSLCRQESIISKQSHLLPEMTSTVIPAAVVEQHALMQAHCRRIADFLEMGQNVWWCCEDGHLRFFDAPGDEVVDSCPPIHHFRSHSLKDEYIYLEKVWDSCIRKLQDKTIQLPLKKIKIYKNGKLSHTINTSLSLENTLYDDIYDQREDTDEHGYLLEPCQQQDNQSESSQPSDSSIQEPPQATTRVCNEGSSNGLSKLPTALKPVENESELHNKTDDGKDGVKTHPEPKQPEIFRNNFNETMKRKYMDYITDLRQTSTCTDKKLKTVKRQLFKTDPDNQEQIDKHNSEFDMGCPFESSEEEEEPHNSMEENTEERIPTSQLIINVLGETEDVNAFLKYRRLANTNPATFLARYQMAKAIVETRLLKKHSQLKKKTPNSFVKKQFKMVENIMDRWGTYYQY